MSRSRQLRLQRVSPGTKLARVDARLRQFACMTDEPALDPMRGGSMVPYR